jgi:MFS family permease
MYSSAVMMVVLSQMHSYVPIVLTVAGVGLASELYRPASSALLADLVPEGERVIAFAAYRLAINAGFAFGPALAGFIANRSFFYLFLGDALTSAAFGTIALTLLPQGRRTSATDEGPDAGVRTVLRDRPFMMFCLATITISFVYFQGETTLALHVRANGMTPANYGTLISLNGLIIVFLELAFSGATQRRKARPVLAVGALLTGAGFTLTLAAHSMLPLAATVFVWTIGEIIHAPVAQAYVADLAPAHMRGRYLGVWGFSFGVAFILAPTAGAWLFELGPNYLWLTCGALSIVAAVLILWGPERRVVPDLGLEPGPEIAGVET